MAVAAVISASRVALGFIVAPAVVGLLPGCVSVTVMLSVAHHFSLLGFTFVVGPAGAGPALVEEASAAPNP